MTTPDATAPIPRGRRVICARCGTDFSCGLSGDCWCAAEPVRLPLFGNPSEDCLCPSCLRKAAQSSTSENV
jgi:Cysteine-rich CWC